MQMLTQPVEYVQALATALTLDTTAYQANWYGDRPPAIWPARVWGSHCRQLLVDALSNDPERLNTARLRAFLDTVRAAGLAWPEELLPLVTALGLGDIPAVWHAAHRLRMRLCFGRPEARQSWRWLAEHDPGWQREAPLVIPGETSEENE